MNSIWSAQDPNTGRNIQHSPTNYRYKVNDLKKYRQTLKTYGKLLLVNRLSSLCLYHSDREIFKMWKIDKQIILKRLECEKGQNFMSNEKCKAKERKKRKKEKKKERKKERQKKRNKEKKKDRKS